MTMMIRGADGRLYNLSSEGITADAAAIETAAPVRGEYAGDDHISGALDYEFAG